jgi:hypothetical protein
MSNFTTQPEIISVATQLRQMEDVISHNLRAACTELVQWHKIGVLKEDGIIRCAASRLTDDVFNGTQLVHAENCVNRLAVEHCSMPGVVS